MLCALVFAGICFSGTPMTFEGASAGTGYRIRVESSYVAQSRGSDSDAPVNWQGAHQACVAGKCLRYWRHCDTEGKELRCRYDFLREGAPAGNQSSITVTAANLTSLAAAAGLIGIEMGDGLELPLALMTARSTGQ